MQTINNSKALPQAFESKQTIFTLDSILGIEKNNIAKQRAKRNRSKAEETFFEERPREAFGSGGSKVDLMDRLIDELETDQAEVRVKKPAANPFKKQKVDNF